MPNNIIFFIINPLKSWSINIVVTVNGVACVYFLVSAEEVAFARIVGICHHIQLGQRVVKIAKYFILEQRKCVQSFFKSM